MFISNNHKNQSNKTSPIFRIVNKSKTKGKKLLVLREIIPLLTLPSSYFRFNKTNKHMTIFLLLLYSLYHELCLKTTKLNSNVYFFLLYSILPSVDKYLVLVKL